MKKNSWWLVLSLTSILNGCCLGPKYSEPYIEMPEEWHACAEEAQPGTLECFSWWESLSDPMLDSLIERAALQNLDLQIALTRIMEARIELKGGKASLYPRIDASLTYGGASFKQKTVDKVLGNHSGRSGQRNIGLFEAGFDAEWELDLFGMNAAQMRSLNAKEQVTQEEFRHVWVTLSAEIARNYIELRGFQQKLEVLKKNIQTQSDTLKLTNSLTTAGFGSIVDQTQVQEQLQLLSAQKPQLELQIHKAIYRLSILLGYNPSELFAELCTCCDLPVLPCQRPLGIPSELLRRRPDIRKSERELAAASAQVDSAIAALFPRVSLYGFIGDLAALSSGNGLLAYGGPQLLMPIFNSRLLQQDVCLNKVRLQQALLSYQKTILEALEEAEGSIASFHYELERNQQLSSAEQASREVREFNRQLYENGFKNYLEFLVVDRSYLSTESALLDSRIDLLLQYVALYKALGGGWDVLGCEQK